MAAVVIHTFGLLLLLLSLDNTSSQGSYPGELPRSSIPVGGTSHAYPGSYPGGGGGGGYPSVPAAAGPGPNIGKYGDLPSDGGDHYLPSAADEFNPSLGPGPVGIPDPYEGLPDELPPNPAEGGGDVQPGGNGEGSVANGDGEAGSGINSEGLGDGVDQGYLPETRDHNADNSATGNAKNDSNGEIPDFSNLTGESEDAQQIQSAQKNVTVEVTPEDNFNYVGMYVTVALFIAFIVIMVAIALIRGPQGPFKTKRSNNDILIAVGAGPGEVVILKDGGARTVAQWEQQPLQSDYHDGGALVDNGGLKFTTVTITENAIQEEKV